MNEMPDPPRTNPVGTDEHESATAFDVNCHKLDDEDDFLDINKSGG